MSPKKFWISSALILCLAMGAVAWVLSQWYLTTYIKQVGDRLELLVELRKGAVEGYFSTAEAELQFWSTNPDILLAHEGFNAIWTKGESDIVSRHVRSRYVEKNPYPGSLFQLDDAGDNSTYSMFHGQLHPLAKLFVSERGYYDVFLIGPEGEVYYSVEKESDFGSNLRTGPLRNSGLAAAYEQAMQGVEGEVYFSDMRAYGPSDNAPAMFMAKALRNANGSVMGVIAFQLPTTKILQIMAYLAGMGDTGETYLVGQDKLMRSNSRFSDTDSVLVQSVDTVVVSKALAGNSGVGFISDYRGVEVMSAYTSVAVGDHIWAVVAEFDREEIVTSSTAERPTLAGVLLFLYGLSMWSIWYWRGSRADGDVGGGELAEIELSLDSFPDSAGLGG